MLASTPHCCLGLRATKHAFQTSMTWTARRCRRALEAIMQVINPRCAGLDVHKQTVVAWVRIFGDVGLKTHALTQMPTTSANLDNLCGRADCGYVCIQRLRHHSACPEYRPRAHMRVRNEHAACPHFDPFGQGDVS